MSTPLPIDEVLPSFLKAAAEHPAVVLQAPPGAGKTTRIPLALFTQPWLNGTIVMLEPRRLAAANAARWMASLLGEEVGQTVGYRIRFETRVSAATRIEVVTEGILTRRLQDDPLLEGVGAVIFDEFHERSLASDTALALCRDIQTGLRDDLRIVVMSATLDAGPVARLLGDAPLIESRGKSFPVDVRYLPADPERKSAEFTATAIRRALAETDGDVLAFLPGAGEIRRCYELLADEGGTRSPILVCPLYGELSFAEQERAIVPADRRKVVLATNIAETSLTIEGVRVVVDSGFTRRLRFDPASGLDRLETVRVSAASADQRAGRAGRTAPGVCYRLWSRHTQNTLVPFDLPEIRAADLASLALDLALWGVMDATRLVWLDPPSEAFLAEGRSLLVRLGALDDRGMITPEGRKMAALPVHPRLAHMLLAARDRDDVALGCDIAALLGERDLLRRERGEIPATSASDLQDRLEVLAAWRNRSDGGAGGLVPERQACRRVDRVAAQLRRIVGGNDSRDKPTAARIAALLARAYPDRIGKQREPGSDRYLLASGRGARLDPRSAVRNQQYLVAVSVEGGGEGVIRMASAIDRTDLEREMAPYVSERRVVAWDQRAGRVVARLERCLDAVVLDSRPLQPDADEVTKALLEGIVAGPGLEGLGWTPATRQLLARVRFLARRQCGAWPDFSQENLLATLGEWLAPFLGGLRSLAEVARLDLAAPLKSLLSRDQLRRLEEGAPAAITVPSGSRARIEYGEGDEPVLAIKLQELFGLAETPRIAWGTVPLLLHLLSPAGRPIQVTRDLRNFWDRIYPEVRKELKGRYPRHPWPDDPWNAMPTRFTKKRSEQR